MSFSGLIYNRHRNSFTRIRCRFLPFYIALSVIYETQKRESSTWNSMHQIDAIKVFVFAWLHLVSPIYHENHKRRLCMQTNNPSNSIILMRFLWLETFFHSLKRFGRHNFFTINRFLFKINRNRKENGRKSEFFGQDYMNKLIIVLFNWKLKLEEVHF